LISPADVEWAKRLMGKQINTEKPANVDWNNVQIITIQLFSCLR
jgi:hypothetical protein